MPSEIGFSPKVSIVINSGEMISRDIGSATLKRLDFTVIGDSVNTSQRLQCTAAVGQIVIPEKCYEKVKKSFICEKIGSIALKNKTEEMVIYEVISWYYQHDINPYFEKKRSKNSKHCIEITFLSIFKNWKHNLMKSHNSLDYKLVYK